MRGADLDAAPETGRSVNEDGLLSAPENEEQTILLRMP
jgi:hypothetical protein